RHTRFSRDWSSDVCSSDLGEIADIISERTGIDNASMDNYISTENMKNNFGGIVEAEKLPTSSTINSFKKSDVLFSNIRTYFKKVDRKSVVREREEIWVVVV